jgi:hypothetical protein
LEADEFHPSLGDIFIDVDGEAPVIEDGFALDGVREFCDVLFELKTVESFKTATEVPGSYWYVP